MLTALRCSRYSREPPAALSVGWVHGVLKDGQARRSGGLSCASICGRGFATEGAIAATEWALDHLGWTEVIHSIDPANVASQRVARKLGSRNRGPGVLPAPLQDARVDIWGQSREEWRARR